MTNTHMPSTSQCAEKIRSQKPTNFDEAKVFLQMLRAAGLVSDLPPIYLTLPEGKNTETIAEFNTQNTNTASISPAP